MTHRLHSPARALNPPKALRHKRGWTIAAACTLIWVTVPVSAADGSPLLGFDWGTARTVVAEEGPGELVIAGSRRVVRHAAVGGIPMTLNYLFDDNGLWQVRYFNRARYDDPVGYVDDYDTLLARLTDMFGEPETERRQWRNDDLRDRPEYHGQAVQVGHLKKMAGWATERAVVLTTLDNESFRPVHKVMLTDPTTR